MRNLMNFLSGEVPGGIVLLAIIIFAVNITFILLKSSKIFSAEKARKNQLFYSIIILMIYSSLWLILQPPLPKVRVMVLPTVNQNNAVELNSKAFALAESFERAGLNNTENKYIIHRWSWLFETIGNDSVTDISAWVSTALRMNSGILIESEYRPDGGITCTVSDYHKGAVKKNVIEAGAANEINGLLNRLNKQFKFFSDNPVNANSDMLILDAKISLLQGDTERVSNLIEGREYVESKVLRAFVLMKNGMSVRRDREKAKYTKIVNNDFEAAKRILHPIIKDRKDTPEVPYLLGRIALREEDYPLAELFLKKAIVDDPSNPRVLFSLSYLLSARLQELGYESRIKVLEKAVLLDPGYVKAVYELANEYYLTGTGTQVGTGTIMAMETIDSYMKIKTDDPTILSLLGMIYIKTNRFDDAFDVNLKLQKQYPDDSNVYYNLGVVSFHQKKYEEALKYFKKAIAIDQNLDSYLYMGITYRQIGEREKALKYYRERIKRKKGDDDIYAKEAMTGIRKILDEINQEKAAANIHEN
ncbi:MAG: tetratricopeptide repeat protein [Calditrichaceae bacterium]